MIKVGVCVCGSFCTIAEVTNQIKSLVEKGYDVTPIFSRHVREIDTRFGDALDVTLKIEDICGKKAITTIPHAERIGPDEMFDVLVLAPCTGNTLSKLSLGMSDNVVTLAVKSHLRNQRPVVVALATNDGLSANLQNIATILNRKYYYFVPFGQDNAIKKPNSLVCNMDLIEDTLVLAMKNIQIQPLLKNWKNRVKSLVFLCKIWYNILD